MNRVAKKLKKTMTASWEKSEFSWTGIPSIQVMLSCAVCYHLFAQTKWIEFISKNLWYRLKKAKRCQKINLSGRSNRKLNSCVKPHTHKLSFCFSFSLSFSHTHTNQSKQSDRNFWKGWKMKYSTVKYTKRFPFENNRQTRAYQFDCIRLVNKNVFLIYM